MQQKYSILVSNYVDGKGKEPILLFTIFFSLQKSLLQGTATLDVDLVNFHEQANYVDFFFISYLKIVNIKKKSLKNEFNIMYSNLKLFKSYVVLFQMFIF